MASAPGQSAGTGACAAGAVQPCPLVGKPCAGQGMSDQKEIDAYAKEMAALRGKWNKLTPDQRRAALDKAVSDAASSAGVPAPTVTSDGTLGKNTSGVLRFKSWNVAVNQALISQPHVSDADFQELSDTVYHETRHSEQWYLIARRDAANGLTADQITAQRGIPPAIAKEAVKNPLNASDPRRACADALYESVYGTGRAARNATLTALGPNATALDTATKNVNASNAAYQKLAADPAATAAQKQAALTKAQTDYAVYQSAKLANDTNYALYRALPEEADAWDSGTRAGDATKAALQPPKKGK